MKCKIKVMNYACKVSDKYRYFLNNFYKNLLTI